MNNAQPTASPGRVEPFVPGRFQWLRVVVTGAGSGIGLATTVRIAEEGGSVLATDVDPARLKALVRAHPELDITPIIGDVRDDLHIAAIAAACGDVLDGLVNNAGINDGFTPLDEVTDALWDQILAINLTAPFKLTRALLPALQRSPQGAIVNVSSEAGLRGSCSGTAYTVSKHALLGLTRSIAVLYDTPRCNAIAPGGVATNIDGKVRSERGAQRLMRVNEAIAPPLAQPEQLAAAIAFLLSRDSSNINGVTLPCDGGWNAL